MSKLNVNLTQKKLSVNINKTGPKGEAGNDGADGASSYTYVAYASDNSGTDFSLTPAANLTFIAVLTTDTEIASPSAGDFAGLWTEYKSDIQNFTDLSDVTITDGAENDLLTLESGVWVNKSRKLIGVDESSFGSANLKSFKEKVAKYIENSPDGPRVIMIGDSWLTNEDRMYLPFRDYIERSIGVHKTSYSPANTDINTISEVTRTRTGTWTDDRISGNGLDASESNTTDGSATLSFENSSIAVSKYIIHYLKQPNGGIFTYQIDSGSTTNVDTSNASEVYSTVEVTGRGVLNIAINTAGSAGVTIYGVEIISDNSKSTVHKLGNGGATSERFATIDETSWDTALTSINPDVAIVSLGINDHSGDINPTTFKTNIETIVSRLQSVNSYIDICLVGQGDTNLTTTYDMAEYNEKLYEIAKENDLTFINLLNYLGDYSEVSSKSLYSDGVHPNASGGQVIGQAFRDVFYIDPYNLSENFELFKKIYAGISYDDIVAFDTFKKDANPILISDSGHVYTDLVGDGFVASGGHANPNTNGNVTVIDATQWISSGRINLKIEADINPDNVTGCGFVLAVDDDNFVEAYIEYDRIAVREKISGSFGAETFKALPNYNTARRLRRQRTNVDIRFMCWDALSYTGVQITEKSTLTPLQVDLDDTVFNGATINYVGFVSYVGVSAIHSYRITNMEPIG